MKKLGKSFLPLILGTLLSTCAGLAQVPRIFFTDLTSGPNTGGENNHGTILTIYGKGFGATPGTVTVGGGAVAAYLGTWGTLAPGEIGTQKISVAIGSAAATGNVVVNTSAGPSNAVPFTVRSGNIYCVSTTGSDSNPGTFAGGCWATISKAKNTIAAGDIAYIQDGVQQTALDGDNAALDIRSGSGTASSPKALVGYPGASVTIGCVASCTSGLTLGIRTASSDNTAHWVISEISNLTATDAAMELDNGTDWRFVGNTFTCPHGDNASACFHADGDNGSQIEFLGNYVHNTGNTCVSNCHVYHAVYFSTNVNSLEVGWNTVVPDPSQTGVAGCKAIQFYSTGGSDQFDLHVHDNIIHDVIADGIDFDTVNPDGTNSFGGQGSVEAYNNVIYRVGTGPPPNSESDYACFEVGSTATRTNPIEIYNNSMYDCGSRGNSDSGMISFHDSNIKIHVRNNIFHPIVAGTFTEPYFTSNSTATACDGTNATGSNNVWYGTGAPPCGTLFTSNVNSDPLYIDPLTKRNFRLQSGSPAIDAGTTISTLTYDLDGVSRPQGAAYDIGAYEFGSGVQRPNPPTNLVVVSVN